MSVFCDVWRNLRKQGSAFLSPILFVPDLLLGRLFAVLLPGGSSGEGESSSIRSQFDEG